MFDVLVIGGGAGGYAAAIRASQLGGRVALVEAAAIGGACVHRGCIPTKVWMRTAYLLHCIRRCEDFGIQAPVQGIELAAIVNRKDGISKDIRMGMEGLLANNGVKVYRGSAVLRSPREVNVDGATLPAKRIIIATGSRLHVPDVPGLEEAAMTTDQVLEMKEIPASVLLLGLPGPVEVEMAALLNTFGARVFLASESHRLLPNEDGDTGQRLGQALREQGVELIMHTSLESVYRSKAGFKAVLSGAEDRTLEVEKVLVTTRKPNSDNLGLEEIGVRVNELGAIQVNEMLQSSVENVFAVGDVTGGWMLSHGASCMAIAAAENAMGRHRKFVSHLVPRGVWSIPEVGAVGLSEEEAAGRGIEVEVGDFPYSINGLAMARNEMKGAVKIVSDSRFGEILGVHIVGPNATELVAEAVLAMQLEARVSDLAYSIRVHPTFSEGVGAAAQDAENWALYLPRR